MLTYPIHIQSTSVEIYMTPNIQKLVVGNMTFFVDDAMWCKALHNIQQGQKRSGAFINRLIMASQVACLTQAIYPNQVAAYREIEEVNHAHA